MLAADQLAFSYPGGRAYEFTFGAHRGEVTAVMGPSGAGKSTLLDLIAGFATPAAGTLDLDGADLLPLPPERRPVSILLQSESLFDHLRAGQNLALGLPPRTSRPEREARIARALAEVGLPDVSRQRAATLSGGEKQRVALARTLLRDKPVLLLDEPFSALDDETRAAVRSLVAELTRKRSWTTILVSHHADDVAELAARRYRLVDGRLIREG